MKKETRYFVEIELGNNMDIVRIPTGNKSKEELKGILKDINEEVKNSKPDADIKFDFDAGFVLYCKAGEIQTLAGVECECEVGENLMCEEKNGMIICNSGDAVYMVPKSALESMVVATTTTASVCSNEDNDRSSVIEMSIRAGIEIIAEKFNLPSDVATSMLYFVCENFDEAGAHIGKLKGMFENVEINGDIIKAFGREIAASEVEDFVNKHSIPNGSGDEMKKAAGEITKGLAEKFDFEIEQMEEIVGALAFKKVSEGLI